MDINGKYLVSGSFDGLGIISGLSDFKPVNGLITQRDYYESITGVVLNNNYIPFQSNLGLEIKS